MIVYFVCAFLFIFVTGVSYTTLEIFSFFGNIKVFIKYYFQKKKKNVPRSQSYRKIMLMQQIRR